MSGTVATSIGVCVSQIFYMISKCKYNEDNYSDPAFSLYAVSLLLNSLSTYSMLFIVLYVLQKAIPRNNNLNMVHFEAESDINRSSCFVLDSKNVNDHIWNCFIEN